MRVTARLGRPAAGAVTLLLALGPLAAPARAAPGDDMPLTITVTQLDPRTVTPDSPITVIGTVTNTADVAITDLVIRLQRGPVLTTRDELRDNDGDPSSSTSGFAPFIDLLADLDAGDTAPFRYQSTAEELGLTDLGVYPLMVNVNGTPDGDVEQRVGQLDSYLPFFPEPPLASTGVAWLWPLVDRPHRGPDGLFMDDDLAAAVAGGGRLERMLAIAEADPQVPLTIAVDPLLVETLRAMAGGYRLADGSAGEGAAAAAEWLDRLTALARTRSVIALPYADADVVALTRAGLADQALQAVELGAQLVSDLLGVQPGTELSWPVDGQLTDSALAVLQRAGAEQFVLSAEAVEPADDSRTPSAAATVSNNTGTGADALVSDPVLDGIVAAADDWPTGPRMAEQRYLAELAMITAEAPSVGRALLVAPPRRWDARVSYALPMLTDTVTEPWLRPVEPTALGELPAVDRGDLVYPDSAAASELDPTGLAVLAAAAASVGDFESMLVLESAEDEQAAQTITDPLDRAVLAAASSYRRGNPAALRGAAEAVVEAVEAQRRRVFLIVPTDGTYSLASARASLVFTVENQLPVPVQVRISVDASLVAGLSTDEVGTQVLAAARRTLIEVPATVERPGEFRVTSAIFTPAGGTLGDPVRLTVRSTVYGGIALVITIGAGALLLLLFALRLIRRFRSGGGPRDPTQPIKQVPLLYPAPAVSTQQERSRWSRDGSQQVGR